MKWQWQSFNQFSIDQLYELMVLRQEVFVVEQACVYLDADGLDLVAQHLTAWRDQRMIACLRLLPPPTKYAQAVALGRIATRADGRGLGLGREMMTRALEKSAKDYPNNPIKLSGQAYLRTFYESFGFRVEGEPYLEDEIPHLAMIREV